MQLLTILRFKEIRPIYQIKVSASILRFVPARSAIS